jgi:hypothetical protein
MANLIDFKSNSITNEELNVLKGGIKYYIGGISPENEVSKEIYKSWYKCKTGNDSLN